MLAVAALLWGSMIAKGTVTLWGIGIFLGAALLGAYLVASFQGGVEVIATRWSPEVKQELGPWMILLLCLPVGLCSPRATLAYFRKLREAAREKRILEALRFDIKFKK
jgi:hypothetical protein